MSTGAFIVLSYDPQGGDNGSEWTSTRYNEGDGLIDITIHNPNNLDLPDTDAGVPGGNNPSDVVPGLEDEEAEEGQSSCEIDGVGWIVCPVFNFLGKITDGAYAALESFLVFSLGDNALETGDDAGPVYKIWSNIRNLANIMFIFAFFFIIFSQATSIGISSYGIKKLLPRLVIAAILVNLSYFLCVFAIDVSNVIGAGLDGIIMSALNDIPNPPQPSWEKQVGSNLAGLAVGGAALTVAGAAAGVGIFWGIISVLAGLLMFAVLAVMVALIIVIGRQAFLILLIVVAPLAFVAYILPNTEGWFDKWKKLFVTLLLFYPLAAVLFAGSKVASIVLMQVAQNGQTIHEELVMIFALGVAAIPLFGMPWLLKFSGGALGKLAGIVNNRNKGIVDRSRNWAKNNDAAQYKKQQIAADKRATKSGNYSGGNIFRRGSSAINRRANKSTAFNAMTSGFGASRELSDQSDRAKNREDSMKTFANDTVLAQAWLDTGGSASKEQLDRMNLSSAQKQAYTRLRNAQHNKNAESFMAAQMLVSSSGEGSMDTLQAALAQIRDKNKGTYLTDANALIETSRSNWKNAGRGDLAGRVVGGHVPGFAGAGDGIRPDWQKADITASGVKYGLTDDDPQEQVRKRQLFMHEYTTNVAFAQKVNAAYQRGQIKDVAAGIIESMVGQTRLMGNAGNPNPGPAAPGGPAPGPGPAAPGGPAPGPAPSPGPAAPGPQSPLSPPPTPAPVVMPSGNVMRPPTPQQYTANYSRDDLLSLGGDGIRNLINNAAGGMLQLSDGDIAKLANAVRGQNSMQDLFSDLMSERDRRRQTGGQQPPTINVNVQPPNNPGTTPPGANNG